MVIFNRDYPHNSTIRLSLGKYLDFIYSSQDRFYEQVFIY